ncbi:MAG: Gfo/Idh/MocA family oxidoreductase [Chloroflexota bacterium]
MGDKVRIGVVGTSWWADSMYLPALARHPQADVRAIAGTRPEHTRSFAAQWNIPSPYDTYEEMLEREPLDAVVVLSPNRLHHPHAMAALQRGLHVLCEKPLGMTSVQAREMTETAERLGVVNMCPFTYSFMPFSRYTKELVDEGYIGRPYHLNMRYFADYGRDPAYIWRFDLGEAGAGISGDLGSHWSYIATWLFGEVKAVTAVFGHVVERGPRPDGQPFEATEDSAMILLEFESGATGNIHVSSTAYEPSRFGQLHAWELHGSEGTIHVTCDWDNVERVEGVRIAGSEADRTVERPRLAPLPIPDRFYEGLRRDTVHNTYKDTFRERDNMARGFVTAIASGGAAVPSFRDGWRVQRIVDAAGRSAREGRRITIAEIAGDEIAADA